MGSREAISKYVGRAAARDMAYFAASRISDRISKTPEGYLLCLDVPVARTGELTYAKGELLDENGDEVVQDRNGIIKVTRDEADLFAPATIASFEGKALTVDHPEEFVCPATYRDVAVGHMQNVRRGEGEDADKLLADFLITDPTAISLVESPNGLREVSLGYDADYEEIEPGLARQTNIMGNHGALVRKGRNGSEVAVRDSAPVIKHRSHIMSGKKKPVSVGDALKKLLGRAFDEAMPDEQPAEVVDNDMETRIKNIEDALAKLIGGETGDEEVVESEGEAVVEDADPACDTDSDASKSMDERVTRIEDALIKLAGAKAKDKAPAAKANDVVTVDADTLSRAEILAPGLKLSANIIAEALAQFAKNEEGAVILKTFDSLPDQAKFMAASEVVKTKRATQHARPTIDSMVSLAQGPMTPEKINELNAAHFNGKK